MCYNPLMEIVRYVVLGLLVIYLLLAFVFIHISLGYRRDLVKSGEKIYSLFAGQIALFALLDKIEKNDILQDTALDKLLEERKFTELNKIVAEKERNYQDFFQKKAQNNSQIMTALKGLEENVSLIRNEIYRHNRLIDNINVNTDSLIFALFVVILKLRRRPKI